MENTPVNPGLFLDREIGELNDPDDLDAIRSPCTSICRMNNDTGLCEGCARTLDEIAAWSGASDDRKRAIWQNIKQRRAGPQ